MPGKYKKAVFFILKEQCLDEHISAEFCRYGTLATLQN